MSTLTFGEWPSSTAVTEDFGNGSEFGNGWGGGVAATSGWEAAWPSSSKDFADDPLPSTAFEPLPSGFGDSDGFHKTDFSQEAVESLAKADVHSAETLSDALNVKAPLLRRRAAELADGLSSLRSEAGHQAQAAERCVSALYVRAEELAAELTEAQAAAPLSAEAVQARQAILQEEVRVLERRAEVSSLGGSDSPAWAAAELERREVLEARISEAQVREAAASELATEQISEGEGRLAEIREELQEMKANSQSATGIRPWRARFEALVTAQNAIADRAAMLGPDPGSSRLDQALSAASAAAGAASGSHAAGARGPPPEYLIQAVRCICGLAEAERRRGGLLVERWRELQGNTPWQASEGKASIPPPDRPLSPSQPYEWNLDMCRATS